MQSITQYALVASIFASVIGALVMCVLVFRYGFTVPAPSDSEDGPTPTDVLVTRVGHAVAGACFAATAVLAIVGLALRAPQATTSRAPAPVPPAPVAATVEPVREAPSSQLPDEVDALQRRLARAEAELTRINGEMKARSARAEARVPTHATAPSIAPAAKREARAPVPPPTVTVPAPSAAPEPPRPAPVAMAPVTAPSTPPAPAAPPAPAPAAVPSTSGPAATPAGTEEVATSFSTPPAPRVATPVARAQEPTPATKPGNPTPQERAAAFMDDVRAALTRFEGTVVRYLGKDPQGRVSARE
jgi:hypothetical protein